MAKRRRLYTIGIAFHDRAWYDEIQSTFGDDGIGVSEQ